MVNDFYFSVLMSLYHKEKPEYLEKCFESIWNKQNLKPSEIVSVHDKFHRTLILSGFCLLKIAKISLNSSFFPKPIKR